MSADSLHYLGNFIYYHSHTLLASYLVSNRERKTFELGDDITQKSYGVLARVVLHVNKILLFILCFWSFDFVILFRI